MPDFAEPLWLVLLALLPALPWLRRRRGVRVDSGPGPGPEPDPARESVAPGDGSPGRLKHNLGDGLRCLALGALIVALAGPLKGSYPRHTDVMFALDVSSSLDPDTAARAIAFVNRALQDKDPAARMGLVVFGADAAVELLLRSNAEPLRDVSVEVPRGGTDIGRALEVAVGAFASESHRRVVLLSDGRENLGNAHAAASVARSLGVEIIAVPLEKNVSNDEIHVQGIRAPAKVRAHEPFEVQVVLQSRTAAQAHLVLMRNGVVLHDENLQLSAGTNVFSLVEQATRAGLHEYEAIVNSDADQVLENNRYQAFVRVSGAPKVLHVVGQPESAHYVSDALRAQNLIVDEISGIALPGTLHELVEYDVIILNNVSGFDLSLEKMEQLERYVRDTGGGLVKLGGDRSYSAGGYYETPVERLLPVTMDVKTEMKVPSLAVIFVIDKSGSMSSTAQGKEKLEVAKVAALSAIEVLNPLDRVAVLAFDAVPEWSVPPTEAGNRRAIAETLRLLGAGGSTNLFTALEEAHRGMLEQTAKVKHLIVLSDGLSDTKADYEALASRINQDGITISTVSFGDDADLLLMARIAARGKGRFYHTEDARNVPRIFTSETLVVSRDLLVEKATRPLPAYPGEMLEGFDPEAFPMLAGYQRTFPKPAAQVLLRAGEEDPLLVAWRYGLGKSVAFTSDLAGRWGRDWVVWPEFGRFVSQMARWTMRRSGTETLLPSFRWHGRRAEISVDVLDHDERFVNHLDMQATVVDPNGETRAVTLEQIAPGRYQGGFEALPAGRYYVNIIGTSAGVQVGPETFAVARPYSSEYADLGVDREHLQALASTTGGQVLPLSNASLATITQSPPQGAGPRWRVWWPLLLAALILLISEIAVRKLALPESWQRRLARWLRQTPRDTSESESEPDYAALKATIAAARAQHIEALRDEIYYRPDDPSVRARLYVARYKRDERPSTTSGSANPRSATGANR